MQPNVAQQWQQNGSKTGEKPLTNSLQSALHQSKDFSFNKQCSCKTMPSKLPIGNFYNICNEQKKSVFDMHTIPFNQLLFPD